MRNGIYFLLAALTLSAPAHAQTAARPMSFGIVGIVNGVDNVRVNAVLATPPEPDLPCPVRFQVLDGEGKGFNDPEEKILRGGATQSLNFIGDPSIRNGTRLPVRATVAIGNPDEFPGLHSRRAPDAGGVRSPHAADTATAISAPADLPARSVLSAGAVHATTRAGVTEARG